MSEQYNSKSKDYISVEKWKVLWDGAQLLLMPAPFSSNHSTQNIMVISCLRPNLIRLMLTSDIIWAKISSIWNTINLQLRSILVFTWYHHYLTTDNYFSFLFWKMKNPRIVAITNPCIMVTFWSKFWFYSEWHCMWKQGRKWPLLIFLLLVILWHA